MAEKAKKVAIAVDDSDIAAEAFNFYMDNFGHSDDVVVLIHVPEMYNFVDASPSVIHELLDVMKAKIKKLEEKYTELLREKGVKKAKFITAEGKVGEEVIKKAKQENCDVVVVGSTGKGKFKRFILGSTSNYLIHHAEVPVFVYKKPEHQ